MINEKINFKIEKINFEKLDIVHKKEVMDIYNYYAENSFAAYPEQKLPYEFFNKFLDMTASYPAYTITVDGKVAGFCFIRHTIHFQRLKKRPKSHTLSIQFIQEKALEF